MRIGLVAGVKTMKHFKGTAKNGVIVLEKGARLPEGAEVEVRLPKKLSDEQRRQAFERIRRRRISTGGITEVERREREKIVQRILDHQIPGPIGLAEIIEEDKREREERWDYLFGETTDATTQKPPADR
jgi:hypothetical protein